ncbi:MAG: ATP-binding cassette domain-containing protein [Bacteroidota bacterium]
MEPLLDVSTLSHHFGGLQALTEVSFQVFPGECVAVIGPNGAGKSTLFHLIGGRHVIQSGRIQFAGQALLGLESHQITQLGMGQAFQEPGLFPSLTVWEHLQLGQRFGGKEQTDLTALASSLELSPFLNQFPGKLTYGWQKRVALGRALAGNPRLLLLDEPAAGLNPAEQQTWIELMTRLLAEQHVTLLFIEHQLSLLRSLAQRVVALDAGRVITQGNPEEVFLHPLVQAAYFGPPSS